MRLARAAAVVEVSRLALHDDDVVHAIGRRLEVVDAPLVDILVGRTDSPGEGCDEIVVARANARPRSRCGWSMLAMGIRRLGGVVEVLVNLHEPRLPEVIEF
jgi:hypothetical protein